jgi:hypothetical protein
LNQRPRFGSIKNNISLSTLMNRGGFHTVRKEKLEAKVEKKPSLYLVFLPPFSPTSHSLVFPTTPRTPSASPPLAR